MAEQPYATVSIDDLELREVEGIEPGLRAVGYELRPEESRPNVWEYEAGESSRRHRHDRQEEVYLVLSGRFELAAGDETVPLEPGDVVVVPPDTWRTLTAVEAGRVFVYGAPPVADDDTVETDVSGERPGEGDADDPGDDRA
ncbi:cupin domain-containing protein [Halobacteriales archaeon QS_8_69_26]|nr:MAG: cupin domain-containing protein [Halobacteriales archaeon QS_8_69_26]